jgi:hypothetical protein
MKWDPEKRKNAKTQQRKNAKKQKTSTRTFAVLRSPFLKKSINDHIMPRGNGAIKKRKKKEREEEVQEEKEEVMELKGEDVDSGKGKKPKAAAAACPVPAPPPAPVPARVSFSWPTLTLFDMPPEGEQIARWPWTEYYVRYRSACF